MTAQMGVSVNDDRPGQHRGDSWLSDWAEPFRRLYRWLRGRPESESAASHRKGGES